MEVMLNDLSLHGQFTSIHDFRNAIRSLMGIRNKIKQFGRELYCYRNTAQAQITHSLTIQQAVQQFSPDERRAIMSWLKQSGPFWDDDRNHHPDDYFECKEQVVTDTTLGEAAYLNFGGKNCQLVSFSPSDWLFTPIQIVWHSDNNIFNINVPNHWGIGTLELILQAASPPIQTWEQLASAMVSRCTNLTFAADSFNPLQGHPFVSSAARRIEELLQTLNKLKCCFDDRGQRTAEGHKIYQDHFTGEKAWFTDSSISEKNQYKDCLTFNHPQNKNEILFCSWHGKIKSPQLRIHFSDPITSNEPLYIVYIGPKRTKK